MTRTLSQTSAASSPASQSFSGQPITLRPAAVNRRAYVMRCAREHFQPITIELIGRNARPLSSSSGQRPAGIVIRISVIDELRRVIDYIVYELELRTYKLYRCELLGITGQFLIGL